MSMENSAPQNQDNTPIEPTVSPIIAFGRAHAMKLMSVGFIIFAAAVFFHLSTNGSLAATIAVAVGFTCYLIGRVLHVISKRR